MIPLLLLLLLVAFTPCIAQNAAADEITNLPGVSFNINFKQYSGYLNANQQGTWKLHYWLVESQGNAATDPLILWLNGGPGCSSVGGLFEELGPFYPERDGNSLYENVFSWNKVANVLFLESPLGVGFSYDTSNPSNVKADDDMIALENYQALFDFFTNVQPAYANKTFYITGESYAGIYLPTLAQQLVQGINNGSFPNKNFQGMAIGNGYMNVKHLTNSLVLWSNYHGLIALKDWENIKISCCNSTDVDKCNFYGFLNTSDNLNFVSDGSVCGNYVYQLLTDQTPPWPGNQDQYNFYQDCYDPLPTTSTSSPMMNFIKGHPNIAATNPHGTASILWYDSTDSQRGNPCWSDTATGIFLNKPEVQAALHINSSWQNAVQTWHDCNDYIYGNYTVKYTDTTTFFQYVINNVKTPNFRILVYNGDVDTVCNYLGDSWHIRDLANNLNMTDQPRTSWSFRNQIAGYVQRYTGQSSVTIDVLTVKGAGHFVPNDRPGPALQMIANFIGNIANYSTATGIDVTPKGPAPSTDPTTTTPIPTTTTAPTPCASIPTSTTTIAASVTTAITNTVSNTTTTTPSTTSTTTTTTTTGAGAASSSFVLVAISAALLNLLL
uniref:Carboxypeptidase n=1 Tax=Plectus sambesii TaxID=2011161 RepID=A0A914UYE8_9BILA